jgi:hypothetical protein
MSFCDKPDCAFCVALAAAVNDYLVTSATAELIPEIETYLKEQNDR